MACDRTNKNIIVYINDLNMTCPENGGTLKKIKGYSLSKNFNYGVSNGFRTLKNLGKIDLFKESDAPDIWNLYSFQDGQDVVTQIKILK